jgi:PAS domain S-box-containing protein
MDGVESADLPATSEIADLRVQVAQLEQDLSRRTREMVALHEISLEINRQPNLAALLQAIVEKAAGLLNARMGGLYLMRPDGETLELMVGHNLPEGSLGVQLKLGEGLSGRVAQTGQLLVVPDYRVWEGRAQVFEGTSFRRVVGVPLKRGDKIIGVINISDDHRSGWFAEDEIRLVGLFAEQAAIAVDNTRLWEEAQRDLAERQRAEQIQSSLYRISEAAHTAPSLDELYRSIHTIVADLMPARNFGIALYETAIDKFSFPYRADEHYPNDFTPSPRRPGKTLVDYVWQTGIPLLGTREQIQELVMNQQLDTIGELAIDWLGVPLKWQGKSIGIMVVQTYTPGERLTEEHKQILTFVSTQVAMAIQRKRAEQRQASLYRISEAALAARNLDDLYHLLHEIVNELMPARNFGIALYDPITDMIRFPYFVDEDYQLGAPTPRRRGNGMIEFVLRTGEPLLGTQAELNALIEREQMQPVGTPSQSWLGVPLKVQGRSIGVIVVLTYQPGERLTEEHKQILTFVSTQVVAAMQRKRAEQVQTSLYRISEAALAAPSLDDLYVLIHHIVNELMPAKNFYIALYDAATATLTFPYFKDEAETEWPVPSRQRGQGLTEYVLRLGKPWLGTTAMIIDLIVQGEVVYETLGPLAVDWLGVPLKADGQLIGLIAVQSYSDHVRLTEEHKDLLVFVSAQVAMAIQRKRAEAALHDSEEKYRILFSNDLVAICLFDATTLQITDVNDAFLRLYGYQRDEVLGGLTVRDVSAEPDNSAAAVQQATVIGTMFIPLRYHRKKDGTVFPVQLFSGPFLWKGRTVFFAWIQDITDRVRAEAALRESEQRYRALFDGAQRQAQELALLDRVRTALTRELDLAALFRTVVSAITETFGYTLVGLYILEGDELVLQHQIGYEYVLERISIASGITGRVVRTGQAVLLEDVRSDPTFLMAMDGLVSEVCVPLTDQGRVVGVLNVESARGVHLTEADLRLMTVLAEHVSIAISQARLYTEARENAARLTAAFESLPFDFWVTDRAGRYVMQNSRHMHKWGNRLGQHFTAGDINETILRHWHAQHDRVLSGEMFDAETRYDDAAEPRWFYEIVAPVRNGDHIDGTLGVSVEVTDVHRAEEALRESEERYRLLFENNPHPMWAYDVETLAFLAVNDVAVAHYGYSREEFLRMTLADIRLPEDVPDLLTRLDGVNEVVANTGLWRHRKKDGTIIDVEITSHALTLDGRAARIVLATDVTEHRRAEEALRRAQKMESLGVLAGGIAHDFNNLLVAMLGQTSLALGQLPAGSPARQPIEKAVSAARRAADLTRQLLAYSGRGQFERRPIQLNHLIQENLHLFEVAVPKNVLLRSELTEPLPVIMGDAGQIQQVVMNLIINAAEAIGERPGQVVVRTRPYLLMPDKAALWQLEATSLASSAHVLLEVEDNGCGMSQETLSRIFDPFFSTKFTGRGLGLAAVLGIVRGHEGGLRVESALNVGTTFELVFPSEEVTALETLAPELGQEAAMLHHLIMVIDDEEPVRDAVTDILDLEGLSVLTAPDGQAGIELYRDRQADIDLIVLDLSMPGLTGEETFRKLRQINPQVRIMLSSGYSHDEVISRFAGQREVAFIQKPYDASQLVAEVKRQLALPRG